MNLRTNTENHIHITLSRRNLETLTKMLDRAVGITALHRVVSDDCTLVVQAEEDKDHYESKDRHEDQRGRMGIGPEDI